MNSTLIDLRGKLPQGAVDIYQEVQAVASELDLDVLVVGAMARDLVLVHGFGARLERGTRDIDFAVQVRDWKTFEKLSEGLIARGFKRDARKVHRFNLERDGKLKWEIDLLPYGPLADGSGNIKWPPDEAIKMTVLGFEEAYRDSLVVQMGDDDASFPMRVASPAGMSLLKLISWCERDPLIRTKDAKDLNYLMKSYCKIPSVFDRMYDEDYMEKEDYDQDRASARILGRDAGKIAEQEVLDFLDTNLFSKSEQLDSLLREMSPNTEELNYEGSELNVFIEALSLIK